MSEAVLDQRGVVVVCPHCGQRNRIGYDRLSDTTRCGKCKTTLPLADVPIDIESDADFDALMSSASLPVLVDFWAPWCGPCKMVAPEVEKVASANAGKVIVAKVNTENLPALAQRYQVRGIPAFSLFSFGKEAGRTTGAQPASALQAFVYQTVSA